MLPPNFGASTGLLIAGNRFSKQVRVWKASLISKQYGNRNQKHSDDALIPINLSWLLSEKCKLGEADRTNNLIRHNSVVSRAGPRRQSRLATCNARSYMCKCFHDRSDRGVSGVTGTHRNASNHFDPSQMGSGTAQPRWVGCWLVQWYGHSL